MRIPITINKNTLITYNDYNSEKTLTNSLQSNNLTDWDCDNPKNLQEICLQAIAKNWQENPILDEITLTIDRCDLLNILRTDLPLSLTVPKIQDDVYWKRCYLERWPKLIPDNISLDFQISEIVKTNLSNCQTPSSMRSRKSSQEQTEKKRKWKECFLEMHIRDYLEKLKPEDYNAEKIKELSDLCGSYVSKLVVRELQAAENSPSRIPLNAILTGFQNLSELSICFKQTYVGEKFTWNILKVCIEDVQLLAKGLKKCHLRIFRLKNSDIDGDKAILIIKSLLKSEDLQTLDFSHCRISDTGCAAVSKFCLMNPVQELILANNQIGPRGIEALCYAICQSNCHVKNLDLKLNPIGNEGANHLMFLLTMGVRNLKNLFLNGCGIKHLPSLGEMIEHNSSLQQLNLSNNALGEEMGKIILQGLRYNTSLVKLDVRMCRLQSQHEFEILEKITKNKSAKEWLRNKKKPIIIEPQYNFDIPEDLLNEIELVLDNSDLAEEEDEEEEVEEPEMEEEKEVALE